MSIKTIWSQNPDDFDNLVNGAMKDGYKLLVRGTRDLAGVGGFYAELDKPDEEEGDPIEAARIVYKTCQAHESCSDCPIQDICDFCPPPEWEVAE